MNAIDETQLNLIDETRLTDSIQTLADIIGMEAALLLVKRFSGVPLYIPSASAKEHTIANVIGQEAFEKLAGYFPHETIRLPKYDSVERQLAHQKVVSMKREGQSNREIALALNYTQRYVEMLVSEHRDEIQLDLFEGDDNERFQ